MTRGDIDFQIGKDLRTVCHANCHLLAHKQMWKYKALCEACVVFVKLVDVLLCFIRKQGVDTALDIAISRSC